MFALHWGARYADYRVGADRLRVGGAESSGSSLTYRMVGDSSMSLVTDRRKFLQTTAVSSFGYWVLNEYYSADDNYSIFNGVQIVYLGID